MGYKIWRKDRNGWDLAFDAVYPTREKADEAVVEANIRYYELVKYGELTFCPYRDDIKLSKDGSIIDPNIRTTTKCKKPKHQHRERFSRSTT